MRLKVEVGGHAVIVKSVAFFVARLAPLQHVLVRDQRGLLDIQHEVAVPIAAYGISRDLAQVVQRANRDFCISCIIGPARTLCLLAITVVEAIVGRDLAVGSHWPERRRSP